MATFLLLPDDDSSVSTHWIPVGLTEAWQCLVNDDGDSTYVSCDNT